jgi:hypothetical protein
MLLSAMTGCADECSVVWPYLLVGDDLDFIAAPGNVEPLRAEFAAVVEERRRLLLCVLDADECVLLLFKWRRANRLVESGVV